MPTFEMDIPADDSDEALEASLASLRDVEDAPDLEEIPKFEQFIAALEVLPDPALKSLIEDPRRDLAPEEVELISLIDHSLLAPGAVRISEDFAVFIEDEVEYVED